MGYVNNNTPKSQGPHLSGELQYKRRNIKLPTQKPIYAPTNPPIIINK